MWKIACFIGGTIIGGAAIYILKDNRDKKRQKSLQDQIDGLQHDKAEKQKEEAELQRKIVNAQAMLADEKIKFAKLQKEQGETDAMILELDERQKFLSSVLVFETARGRPETGEGRLEKRHRTQ